MKDRVETKKVEAPTGGHTTPNQEKCVSLGTYKASDRSLSQENFDEQNPVRGNHEKSSVDPPSNPPFSMDEGGSRGVPQKNISLSISPSEGNTSTARQVYVGLESIREEREEEDGIERYKKINSVIAPKRRYRKNVIRDRCRQFAQDLEAEGFQAGNKLHKRELRYWIIGLDLAHDKSTLRQYMERLLIYGYFILDKNGQYIFCGSTKPGQLTLMDPEKVRARIHGSLYQDRRIRRRSY